ncbi:juvenile hormone esterase-like isoform X2 [Leptidea sinapis]|uniref:juvenile hormone esterase-like isoform X2 n=1 Tax=Leptidea sinapis TaxID=189913 RepID=UPI00213E4BC1|nr:juvenile hormone esterase-like isoform X2 [Leptidea sinapis]
MSIILKSSERKTMVVVELEQGKLKGVICEIKSGKYCAFKGIPYAKPPIGDLRFKAPEPPEPWQGIRDASEHGPVCPQYNERLNRFETGSEDCLFLNVYSKAIKPAHPLPVMVWIHGGGFYTGSGDSDFYGPDFFMAHDVVLVTFNYRLEVLGFLCLDSEEVPGNAGLKDQVAVLKWVKKNISSFGGNPSNVTIFGTSAGGASVSYHMISDMSVGLFDKAICQSGVCLNDWSYNLYGRQRAFQLGEILGKKTDNVTELLEFLMTVPTESLVNIKLPKLNTVPADTSDALTFAPVIENPYLHVEKFISDIPVNLVRDGRLAKVPLMLGYMSGDGIEVARHLPETLSLKQGSFIPRELKMSMSSEKLLDVDEKVRQQYFGGNIISRNMITEVVRLATDVTFAYNTRRLARYHVKNTSMPVYFFQFSAESERNFTKKQYNMTHAAGVCHSDDLPYLFNITNLHVPLTDDSQQIVEQIVTLWVNFSSFGDPTATFKNIKWKPFKETEKYCFDIDKELKCVLNLNEDNMTLWDEIYKEITI